MDLQLEREGARRFYAGRDLQFLRFETGRRRPELVFAGSHAFEHEAALLIGRGCPEGFPAGQTNLCPEYHPPALVLDNSADSDARLSYGSCRREPDHQQE